MTHTGTNQHSRDSGSDDASVVKRNVPLPSMPTRRAALLGIGAAAAATAVGLTTTGLWAGAEEELPDQRGARTRVLHVTDTHVAPRAGTSFPEKIYTHESLLRQALASGLAQGADAVIQGGDAIYGSDNQPRTSVQAQWGLHQSIWSTVTVPVHHVIGNHDCWYGADSVGDPLAWNAWARQVHGLGDTGYYTAALGTWKLIVLDTMQPTDSGYVAWIDDAQLDWLSAELAATAPTTPIIIAGHIPILTTYAFARAAAPEAGTTSVNVSGSILVLNGRRLLDLFDAYPQVRLVVSGHEHTYETVVYNTVTHATLGSVSGNWDFTGQPEGIGFLQTAIGYTIIDLYEDGTHELSYKHLGPRDDDDFSADDLRRFPPLK